jgi:hypothetical protein
VEKMRKFGVVVVRFWNKGKGLPSCATRVRKLKFRLSSRGEKRRRLFGGRGREFWRYR